VKQRQERTEITKKKEEKIGINRDGKEQITETAVLRSKIWIRLDPKLFA
jgi:hypothetical protein